MSLVPVYRRRPSALHAARAGVGACFCCSLALVGAVHRHPLVLVAALGATVLAGVAAGVGREIRRSLLFALPLALLVALVNPLVYSGGDTLLIRGGELLGRRIDITLEAAVAGALGGLRVVVIVVALGLLSAAVDPDELLRLFRRVSYRSALERVAGHSARAGPGPRRHAHGRCRSLPPAPAAAVGGGPRGARRRARPCRGRGRRPRGARLRAGGRPPRRRRAWSRHDMSVLGAAVAIAAAAIASAAAGVGAVETYPLVEMALGPAELALCAVLVLAAGAPFVGRAGRLGVAHA